MKRLVIIGLLLTLAMSLFPRGGGEKEWIIPSESSWVMGIDSPAVLNSGVGNRILEDFVPGVYPAGGEGGLNQELEEKLGISLQDLGRVTFFGLSPEEGMDFVVGGSLELLHKKPADQQAYLKEKYPASELTFGQYTYTEITNEGATVFLFPMPRRMLIASEIEAMEAMLRVLAGEDELSRNKKLEKMVLDYQQDMMYLVGFLPPEMVNSASTPEFFREVRDVAFGADFTNALAIRLVLNGGTLENAENIVNFFKLTLSMVPQMIPADNPEVGQKLRMMLAPIQMDVNGTSAVLRAEYTVEQILEIREFVIQMMSGMAPVLSGNQAF